MAYRKTCKQISRFYKKKDKKRFKPQKTQKSLLKEEFKHEKVFRDRGSGFVYPIFVQV